MTFIAGLILFIAAVLGGALNSVAGGGSFLTFPSLIFAGVQPIQANATSTVALWPGSVASVSAYRKELATLNRVVLLTLGITSLIGGIGGAILLLSTPQATFLGLVPYLMLLATLLFAFSPRITASRSFSTRVALGPTDFNERDTTHFGWLRHAAAKSRSSTPHSGRSSSQ